MNGVTEIEENMWELFFAPDLIYAILFQTYKDTSICFVLPKFLLDIH